MATTLKRIWSEDEGVLTFEWIALITVLVIGLVGGLSAARDAIIDELGDVSEAMTAVDQSWTVTVSTNDPLQLDFGSFTDSTPASCPRGRPATPAISQ